MIADWDKKLSRSSMSNQLGDQQNKTEDLPQVKQIPAEVIEKWLAKPASTPLQIEITRDDIDQLYFAISAVISSQGYMHTCMLEYSRNNLGNANDALSRSRKGAIEGANHLANFMQSIMLRSEKI